MGSPVLVPITVPSTESVKVLEVPVVPLALRETPTFLPVTVAPAAAARVNESWSVATCTVMVRVGRTRIVHPERVNRSQGDNVRPDVRECDEAG